MNNVGLFCSTRVARVISGTRIGIGNNSESTRVAWVYCARIDLGRTRISGDCRAGVYSARVTRVYSARITWVYSARITGVCCARVARVCGAGVARVCGGCCTRVSSARITRIDRDSCTRVCCAGICSTWVRSSFIVRFT